MTILTMPPAFAAVLAYTFIVSVAFFIAGLMLLLHKALSENKRLQGLLDMEIVANTERKEAAWAQEALEEGLPVYHTRK